jgi:hypothetical protein
MISNFYILSELYGLISCIIFYRRIQNNFFRWTLPFLLLIFFIELIVLFLDKYRVISTSLNIYHLISVLEVVFYSYIFYHLIRHKKTKSIIRITSVLSVLFFIISFILKFNHRNYFIIVVISGFILSIYGFILLFDYFKNEQNESILEEPGFWFSLGVATFFSGTSIVFSLYDFIVAHNLSIGGVKLYNLVPRILSVVLYTALSITVIKCKPTKPYSPTPS